MSLLSSFTEVSPTVATQQIHCTHIMTIPDTRASTAAVQWKRRGPDHFWPTSASVKIVYSLRMRLIFYQLHVFLSRCPGDANF